MTILNLNLRKTLKKFRYDFAKRYLVLFFQIRKCIVISQRNDMGNSHSQAKI